MSLLRRSHAAEIGPMWQRAADWIGQVRPDEQAWIGRCFSVRIVAGKFEIFAVLPPSVLATDDAGCNGVRDSRFSPNRTARAFYNHPLFVLDTVGFCCIRVNIGGRFGRGF